MLCRVNATIGGVTEPRALLINLLRCIQAVCTAAQGSTPSVQPVSSPGTFASGDCIVEVISNAEAGGWTSSSSTNVTTSYSLTNSSIPSYYVDLYNTSTGKTTYPYYKTTFTTNYGLAYNATQANWNSYGFLDMFTGFHTTTTMDGNYLAGFSSFGVSAAADKFSAYTGRPITGSAAQNNPNGASGTQTGRGFTGGNGEYLIASTANYIILINANCMVYTGIRSNAAWENNYTNNPYVIGWSWNLNTNSIGANAIHAFCHGIDTTGAISNTPTWRSGNFYNTTSSSGGVDPITGYSPFGGIYYYYFAGYGSNPFVAPLIPFGLRSDPSNQTTLVGPATDSSSGANVPPAYPIIASYTGAGGTNWQGLGGSVNTGMVLPGIYRSLAGSDAFMQQFYTPGATYVVGTENYYPYTVGTNTAYKDLFLLRKY